jgi:hypothetical protein
VHEIRLGSGALQLCVFCGRSVRALHVASMDLHAALLGRRPEINEQSPAAAVPKSVAVPKSAMTSIMWFTKAVAAYQWQIRPPRTAPTRTFSARTGKQAEPQREMGRSEGGQGVGAHPTRAAPAARTDGLQSLSVALPPWRNMEHPTRRWHRASEGLGRGSFLVHCPYIAARGYFVPT